MPTITDHAIATPDKPAFIMGSTGETVTFGELDAIANQVAQLLRASGVQQGQHIAIMTVSYTHLTLPTIRSV